MPDIGTTKETHKAFRIIYGTKNNAPSRHTPETLLSNANPILCNEENPKALTYREFTRKVFGNSTVLTQFSHDLDMPEPKQNIDTITESNSNSDILKEIAEEIIELVASDKYIIKPAVSCLKQHSCIFYHSLEVMCLTLSMGQKLGYSKAQLKELGIAAMAHDFGKIFLKNKPLHTFHDSLLLQKNILRRIPLLSAALIKKTSLYSPAVVSAITAHQENYIGTGFPFSKTRQSIHPFGMVIHVADDYDAISLYKSATSNTHSYAVNYIKKTTNLRYDRFATTAFLACIQETISPE